MGFGHRVWAPRWKQIERTIFWNGIFAGNSHMWEMDYFFPAKNTNRILQQLLTVVRLIIRQSSGHQTINYILLKSHCSKSAKINNFRHFTVFFGRPERRTVTKNNSPISIAHQQYFSSGFCPQSCLQHYYQWPLAMKISVEILAHILYLSFARFAYSSRRPRYPAVFPFT